LRGDKLERKICSVTALIFLVLR